MVKKHTGKLEFTDTVRAFGNSAHVVLPRSVIGRKVKVTIEFLN